jgi:hypothetical protein
VPKAALECDLEQALDCFAPIGSQGRRALTTGHATAVDHPGQEYAKSNAMRRIVRRGPCGVLGPDRKICGRFDQVPIDDAERPGLCGIGSSPKVDLHEPVCRLLEIE